MTTFAEKVFLDYTQEELDDAYDQARWVPNFEELRQRPRRLSAEVRARNPHFEKSYGAADDETFEIVPAQRTGAPVVLFVHGGRWMAQPPDSFIYFAETIIGAGAHFVAARFGALPPTPGEIRLPNIVDQLRRAVVWLFRNAATFGGNPENIHLIGHSSGGHLASVLLTTDWTRHGLPANVLKSGTCVSGVYDLRPVLLSARGNYVKLSRVEEDELSAIRHLGRVRCPILVAYGDKESPEFKRHGESFSAALKDRALTGRLLVLAGCNHFEGIATMIDPKSALATAVLEHMQLA
ncbi:MAG: alpha/beta hydrolase [Alphaproteobacteria bacterium]|nr:alpha/beta hydrolase [Alphaproteobacteria bacterium]